MAAPRPAKAALQYIKDPSEIYRKSFETIESEVDLSLFPSDIRDVAVRLIHACGMVDILKDFTFSDDAVAAGRAALANGAPIICDVEMVRHGIIGRHLTANNKVLCAVGDEATRTLSNEIKNTRSAAAMDLLAHEFDGAIIVIGNAPTALFRLLELIDAGAAKPALIIGMPVGFVGAAESKDALIADSRGVAYMAVRGRRGGSAMAAATLNAIAAGLKGGL
ncbi:MAG: precorrin-8X methylmutase [Ahrensia sp.]|nr:precorrin-8X methylmutase [Ahrensia sp.]